MFYRVLMQRILLILVLSFGFWGVLFAQILVDKGIYKAVQFELSNSIRIQFAGFVANYEYLQSMFHFQPVDQLEHLRVRF